MLVEGVDFMSATGNRIGGLFGLASAVVIIPAYVDGVVCRLQHDRVDRVDGPVAAGASGASGVQTAYAPGIRNTNRAREVSTQTPECGSLK
jgi:hypothetical protein